MFGYCIFLIKYICSWSGGKDSTASIILAHENNEPLDMIIMSEVMFDKERNISGENPLHMEFVRNVAIPTFKRWGYKVVIVRAEKDFLDMFYHIINKPRKYMEHKGKYYGFCMPGICSVKRDLKIKPIEKYLSSLDEEYVQYLGICADEPKRLASMKKRNAGISLLEKYGIKQSMAKDLCLSYGLYSYGYELSKRGGCIFCPYAKLEEHRYLKEKDPETWARLVSLEKEENVAFSKWNCITKETLEERDYILS